MYGRCSQPCTDSETDFMINSSLKHQNMNQSEASKYPMKLHPISSSHYWQQKTNNVLPKHKMKLPLPLLKQSKKHLYDL